jgi:hypothetical protein
MFNLLKLSALVLLKSHKITDAHSCRIFLRELILLAQPLAAQTKTPLDDVLLKHIEFVVNNETLFEYVYRLLYGQFQTDEILFESAEEETIIGLIQNRRSGDRKSPEAINPLVIVSLVSQIIDLINAIKSRRESEVRS